MGFARKHGPSLDGRRGEDSEGLERWEMKHLTKSALALALLLGTAAGAPAFAQTIELTMWGMGECPPDNCMNAALISAFEAENPDIKINRIQQPVEGYFTSLLAQSVIKRGPDIAAMWAGSFMDQFKPYMVDLHAYLSDDVVASVNGIQFFSEGYDSANAIYAAPHTAQWYNGFYNKKLFAEAGIEAVPTTWDELQAAGELLLAKGITPIVQGASGGSAQFAAWFDWSYNATAVPLNEWGKLMSGEKPYSDPRLIANLKRWQQLYTAGIYNKDAYNHPDPIDDFIAGTAGMYLATGSWESNNLLRAMGDDVGVIIPPYSETPQNAIVSFTGGGYSVMNYSPNVEAAGKFAAFVLSDAGQAVIAKYDAPTRPGFPTNNRLLDELAEMSSQSDRVVYPMFDNFMQGPVADTMNRNIAQVLVGQITPEEALATMDATVASLPAEQKLPISFGN